MTELPEPLAAALADRYRILDRLGEGGMATVYLAEDTKLGRRVAIKVLKPELGTILGAERFLQEVEITAGLEHPHILGLYDSGDAVGCLYYVMPYVEGESLRDRMDREKQLPIEDALQIAREVADALSHAHSHGVLHRDIKPENILLEGGHAVVADFGIARAVTSAGGSRLTETGLAIGTPAYMSPEQATSESDLDGRSDLYALGCVLYEMLTGEPPYTGPSAQAVFAKRMVEPVPHVSTLRETVPANIEQAVTKALAKVPADRFTTAQQFGAALTIPPGEAQSRPRRWGRAVAAGAVLLLALAGGAGAYRFLQTGRPGTLIGDGAIDPGGRVLFADFVSRTADSTLADAVREGLRALLMDRRLVRILDRTAVRQGLERMGRSPEARLDEATARELAERENAQAFVTGEVSRLGTGYQFTARVVDAMDGRDLLVERVTADDEDGVIGAVDRLGARLRRGIGESLRDVAVHPGLAQVSTTSLPALRAYSSAVRLVLGFEAVALLQQAVALDSTFASAYSYLAFTLDGVSRQQEAQQAIEQAYRYRDRIPDEWERLRVEESYHRFHGNPEAREAVLRRMIELDPSQEGYYYGRLSDVRLTQRRFPEAESAAIRAIDLGHGYEGGGYYNALEAQLARGQQAAAERTVERVTPDRWRLALARQVRMALRDWDSALALTERGDIHHAEVIRTIRGRTTPDMRAMGTEFKWWPLQLLRYTGDTTRSLEALAVWRTNVGWDTLPPATRDYGIVIPFLAEAGRLEEARRLMAEWEAAGPDDPRRRVQALRCAGAVAFAEGRFDSAATAFLAWHRAPIVEGRHLHNRGLVEAGTALDRAGHPDSAIALYERALAIQLMDGVHYEGTWYPLVIRRLGELHASLGHREEALGYYGRFVDLWKDADAELQPQVEQVRDRIRALSQERQ